ncbi:MAG: acyltransferase [Nitrospirae bacterium]|nr:acyltransferase [Nitrospirota bacterium]
MIFHASPKYLRGGFIGVDIFFVLSGFLITSLLIKEYENKGSINIKHFYMRRILRLFPALVLFLCGTFIYASLFPHHKNIVTFNDVLIVLFYIANWVRAFKIHISNFGPSGFSVGIGQDRHRKSR